MSDDYDYIVVGSGAGGGTLAARLAEAGKRVALLEAGGDPKQSAGPTYEVPAFHALASEHEAMRWDFFVRHYADDAAARRDPKYREEYGGKRVDGVLYPRAGTLGGCTAHNAMIWIAAHNEDWESIAQLTGDPSWKADAMRRYFERIEDCRYRGAFAWAGKLGVNPSRHGWGGWLQTEEALPMRVLRDKTLRETILDAEEEALLHGGDQFRRIEWFAQGQLDPNDWGLLRAQAEGLVLTPLTTKDHARTGARERVLDVAARKPDRLTIVLNALVVKVLFDESSRALGVEYLHGERLYRAHANPSAASGELRTLRASKEVILAGGAFNTPQLLMLSGIGPAEELRRHGIPLRTALEGVGKNLQDRYEVGVVNRMRRDWDVYAGAKFAPGDPQFAQWNEHRSGVYTSNGSMLTFIRKSSVAQGAPDLFCLSLLARFAGYYPTYSREIAEHLNYLTWVVLKAHTRNRAGEVKLRSADPRDTPHVVFNSFAEGAEADVQAMLEGVRFVRELSAPLKRQGIMEEEELPGEKLQTDEELKEFIRVNAWGHHASCTCPIGAPETGGVVDGNFRVHGVRGLRVVDASIFPRIPGFFIASAVYMIAEKAADVILEEAGKR